MATDISQERNGVAFRALHEGPPFVIPNPWDAGSAKVFAALGFEALATTSAKVGNPDFRPGVPDWEARSSPA